MSTLAKLGYIGLFIGTFLSASVIPLPMSSDILLVGAFAAGGHIWGSVIIATMGNWLGNISSYVFGRQFGKWEWIEKRFKIKREKLEKQKGFIKKYGSILALITWVPFIGEFLAIGLGFYRIRFVPTALLMLLGTAFRFTIYALIYNHFFRL